MKIIIQNYVYSMTAILFYIYVQSMVYIYGIYTLYVYVW